MIRMCVGLVLGVALVSFTTSTYADEKAKEVKLEGTVCCGKCALKISDKCAVTIKVKGKDGKDIVYWFDKTASGKYHDEVCTENRDGTVTGTVAKDGDKMVITVKSLEFKKK